MEMQSLYQVCIFFTVGLMVFTMAINVVVGLGVFGNIEVSGGIDTGDNTSTAFSAFTGQTMSGFWIFIFGGALILTIPIAILTQSLSIAGVYIFSVFFWGSYSMALNIIYIGGFMPLFLIPLFTVPIAFIFIGAVIGMLAGV